ncbi:MAG: hypothetical protein HOV96_38875 [Nonomuraea sp.]|nr:hypothetical protein [Nonomuraea sp.]
MLRLACLALIAVLTTGCTVSGTQTPAAPEDTEEVIVDEPEEGEEEDPASARIAVCVEEGTRTRSEYRPCEDAREGYAWRFYTENEIVPAVGGRADGGASGSADGEDVAKAAPKGGPGADVAIETPSEWVEVCVRKPSRLRVVNTSCEEQQEGFGWYYIPIEGRVPAVGARAGNGTFLFYGGDSYRARESGGDAVDAAIDYEEEVVEE